VFDGLKDAKSLYTELLYISKFACSEHVTGSRLITSRPCYLLSMLVRPTNAGSASVLYLRNGETALADILISVGGQYVHPLHEFVIPVYFNAGLYCDLDTNVASVSIQYLEI